MKTSLAEQTLEKVGWVREGAGERFDEIELQIRYFLAAITDNASGFAQAVAPRFGPDDTLEGLDVGGLSVPVAEDGTALIPFRGPEKTFKYRSATDVLAAVVARLDGS